MPGPTEGEFACKDLRQVPKVRKQQPMIFKTKDGSRILIAVLLLFFLLSNALPGEEVSGPDANGAARATLADAEIARMLRDYIGSDKLGVGMVVGLVDTHGTRVISFGKLDNGSEADVDGDSLFEIGSVTKVFTALLLQDMVERGEMKLEDPAQKYLPDSVRMPTYQGKEITLLHLATHTSGLPCAPNNQSPATWRDPDPQDIYTVRQLYGFLSSYQLSRAPGTKEEYSNLAMQLLGQLMANKAGTSYEELVLDRICRPLGMKDTRITLSPEFKSRLAIGHSMPGARVPNMDFVLPGAGGLRSTGKDLGKFISAYAGLSPTPLNTLMQKAVEFHTMESGGKLMLAWGGDDARFGHNGGTYGYKAIISFDPKRRCGAFVLSNCRNSVIVDALMGPLWEGQSPKPTGTVSVDPAVYARYEGRYSPKTGGSCSVRGEGTRLLLQWIGPSGERFPSYEVFPQSEFIFRNSFWGVEATFFPAINQEAAKLVLASLGPYSGLKEPIILMKTGTQTPATPAPVRPDSRTCAGFVGKYRKSLIFGLFRVGPTLSIFQEWDDLGDHLVARVKGVPGYTEGEFIPVSETSFVVNPMSTADDIKLTFLRNTRGETKAVRVYWNGRKVTGSRISQDPAF
jgi:CubicO group peptidase (beta-lactamase class C family)